MYLFKRDPNTPFNAKQILLTLLVAFVVFWAVLFYLVPMIEIKALHDILQVGTVILAIFFLFDLIF